jgi:hypothetical protein
MKTLLVAIALCCSCFGQGQKANWGPAGAVDFSSLTTWKPAQLNFSSLPSASACTGCVFIVKDASSASSCSSGGSSGTPATCWSSGSAWIATGGGGGGGSGSPGSPALGGTGWTTVDRVTRCATATVSLASGTWTYPGGTASAASATSQEIPLFTSLLNGNMRYDHVLVSIGTSFSLGGSVTAITAGVGRPGGSTDTEMLSLFDITQSAGLFAYDKPQPPAIGSGSYDLVLTITTTSGNVSALSTGSVTVELCAYSIN